MFIIDILIYVFFALVMCNLAKKSYYYNNTNIDIYLWGYICFFTLISAIRWGVGVDSISYATEIMNGKTIYEILYNKDDPEILMSCIIRTIHNLDLHFSFGLGLFAFIQMYFIVKSLKSHKYLLCTLPIIMFGSHYYLDLMNGVRQMMVACVFLWSVKLIYERKPIQYFVLIIAASFLHKSAVMLLPLYFISKNINIANKRRLCMTIFLACFIIGLSPQLEVFVDKIQKIATLVGYSNYSESISTYLDSSYTAETRALGPMQLSYLIIAIASIWFGPKLHKYQSEIPYFNVWYLFSYVYICLYFLFCNVSHILLRPIDYFCLFHMIIVSLMLYDIMEKSKINRKIGLLRTALILIIWTNISWSIIKSHYFLGEGEKEYTTYKVFFMHQDEIK